MKPWLAGSILVLLSCWISLAQQASSTHPESPATGATSLLPPMEAVYNNIQVLKGIPSTQLLPIMNFMRASLGVRCEFCHVAETGHFDLDDKQPKRRAREMLRMTRQLNDTNFDGRNVITCNSCHHGLTTPISVPEIIASPFNTTRSDPGEPAPPPLPSAGEVVARYESSTHIGKLGAARITLEGWHPKIIAPGTPRARMMPRAMVRVGSAVADGERVVGKSTLPDGQVMEVGSDGRRAWTKGPDGLRWIPASEVAQFQRKLNVLLVARVRMSDFSSTSVTGTERIDDRETYMVNAIGTDGTAQTLWFARDDGLLVRRTFYHPIALGLDPEQYDLSEYKTFGGFLLPSWINSSYLDDQHLGVLKRILGVEPGVAVSDSDFTPPHP